MTGVLYGGVRGFCLGRNIITTTDIVMKQQTNNTFVNLLRNVSLLDLSMLCLLSVVTCWFGRCRSCRLFVGLEACRWFDLDLDGILVENDAANLHTFQNNSAA